MNRLVAPLAIAALTLLAACADPEAAATPAPAADADQATARSAPSDGTMTPTSLTSALPAAASRGGAVTIPNSLPIPGVTTHDLLEPLSSRFGLICAGPGRTAAGLTWTCTPPRSGATFLVLITADSVTEVRAVEAAAPDVPSRVAAGLLGYVASLMYEGEHADAARLWVETSIMTGGTLDYGATRIVLDASPVGHAITVTAAP